MAMSALLLPITGSVNAETWSEQNGSQGQVSGGILQFD